eukprot:scaffold70963_cov103-Phaeocystis_antarctica.AAC.1
MRSQGRGSAESGGDLATVHLVHHGWGGSRARPAAKSGAIGSSAARHVWLHRRARAFDGRLSNGSSPMLSASIDVRGQAGGQRAPARRLQVLKAVPYHPLSNPPLPHRARPRAAGDDCLLLAALAVEVCTPGYPHPATLARRAVRAEAEASRLIM